MKDKYSINDFTIVSSECDYELFFNNDYRRVITNSINNLLTEYENNNPNFDYSKCKDSLFLICHRSSVEIKDRRTNPTIHLIDILDNLEKNDIEYEKNRVECKDTIVSNEGYKT